MFGAKLKIYLIEQLMLEALPQKKTNKQTNKQQQQKGGREEKRFGSYDVPVTES